MTLISNSCWIMFSLPFFWATRSLYGYTFSGWLFEIKEIPWSCSAHDKGKPQGVSNTFWCLLKTNYKSRWTSYGEFFITYKALNWGVMSEWPFFNSFSVRRANNFGGLGVEPMKVCLWPSLEKPVYNTCKSVGIERNVHNHSTLSIHHNSAFQ